MKLVGCLVTVQVLSVLCFAITASVAAVSLSMPGCQEQCGNVTVPYPFGIGSKCSANSSYTIICQNSTSPFLSSIDMEVLSISLYGTVIVKQRVPPTKCSDVPTTEFMLTSLELQPFTISTHHNRMVILGCKNSVWFESGNDPNATDVCTSICDANSTETSCNGVNCCQTTIPQGIRGISYTYQSKIATNNTITSSYCGYVFPVDTKWLQNDYYQIHLPNPLHQEFVSVPLVIDWEFGNGGVLYGNCRSEEDDFPAYIGNEYASSTRYCYCPHGFEGNPYLLGCQDIDECSNATLNFCMSYATCINMPGYYKCVFPRSNKYRIKIAMISISTAVAAILLLLGLWMAFKAISRRIYRNRRHNFFKRNGGLLLEQHLSSTQTGLEKTKVFTAQELARATDHYNENRILGRGGQGTVYKGMLADGRIVAIKKAKKLDERDLQVFINEVVIMSQINHRNVVQLLGCCLETQVPLLVYEFVPNGTLFQHIHDPSEDFPLTWEMRLRIAREAAGALAYLHSSALVPIYHRDIKSTNILLDDKYHAKVSDFGMSRSVIIDQSHVTTRVVGTFGYIDPEYFQSSQFTEKSDVYSFGVVLVELLSGKRAVACIREEVGRSLATEFLVAMEEDRALEMVDPRLVEEVGSSEEIMGMGRWQELQEDACIWMVGKGQQ